MNDHFLALAPRYGLSVLLVASPPEISDRHPGLASLSQRQDAVISLARAVFAVGGRLVMMGDPDVAPVVAAVALDYTAAPSGEHPGRPLTPLVIVESDDVDRPLRELMSPYAVREAVEYVDSYQERVLLDWGPSENDLRQARRHQMPKWIAERFELNGAVFIGADGNAADDIDLLRDKGVAVAVLTATVLDRDRDRDRDRDYAKAWANLNPAIDFLDGRPDRWSERDDRPRDGWGELVPYPFVMQRLVAEWAGRPRRRDLA